MRGRAVTFHLGAGMHGELARAGRLGNRERIIERQRLFCKTKAHLGADRNIFGHRPAHSGHDVMKPFRPLQQGRPRVMAVHGLGGAAKIDIDPGRAQLGGKGCVLRHHAYLSAHDLDMDRNARRRLSALFQFRTKAVKNGGRVKMLAHAHKLRHAQIEPADPRQDIAHIDINNPLHGGQRHSGQGSVSSIFLVIF